MPNVLAATVNGGGTSTTVCSGTTVTLAATGATSYIWTSVPSGFTANTASTTAAPTVTTTYSVQGTINGCTFSTTDTVRILTVTLSPTTYSIYEGGTTGNITATTINNIGTVTYAWAPCATLSASTGNPVTATPTGTTTYTVTAFDAGGCTATATIVVSVTDSTVHGTRSNYRSCRLYSKQHY